MNLDRARLTSCIAIAYVCVVIGGIFLHFALTGEMYTLKYSLMLPNTWIAIITGGLIAWGLWQSKAWAWWLGLVAVLLQLTRISSWLAQHFSITNPPSVSIIIVLFILVLFLVVLVLPKTRAACSS